MSCQLGHYIFAENGIISALRKHIKSHWDIPTVSRLVETGMIPIWETAPWEGRNPITPQNAAGTLTPPTVSTPVTYVHEIHSTKP